MMRVENNLLDEFIIMKKGGTINWETPKAVSANQTDVQYQASQKHQTRTQQH